MGPFCGKCGAKTKFAKTPIGLKVFCPKCHPEKNGERHTKSYCEMKQICRPHKCPFGIECPEGRKIHRSG